MDESFSPDEKHVRTYYCLECPCGLHKIDQLCPDGSIGLLSGQCRHNQDAMGKFFPETGEKRFLCGQYWEDKKQWEIRNVASQPCDVTSVCHFYATEITLSKLIRDTWPWEIDWQTDQDMSDYIEIGEKVTLHCYPDLPAFEEFEQRGRESYAEWKREREIKQLEEKLAQLKKKQITTPG